MRFSLFNSHPFQLELSETLAEREALERLSDAGLNRLDLWRWEKKRADGMVECRRSGHKHVAVSRGVTVYEINAKCEITVAANRLNTIPVRGCIKRYWLALYELRISPLETFAPVTMGHVGGTLAR